MFEYLVAVTKEYSNIKIHVSFESYILLMFTILSQAWTFATIVPMVIGHRVPEDDLNWDCYLLLLQVIQFSTAKVVSPSSVTCLAHLIDQHHQIFIQCYPSIKVTPKMHYMVHFSQQIMRLS